MGAQYCSTQCGVGQADTRAQQRERERRPRERERERDKQTSLFVMSVSGARRENWQRRSRARRCCRIAPALLSIAVAASSRAHVSPLPPHIAPRAVTHAFTGRRRREDVLFNENPRSSSGCSFLVSLSPTARGHCVIHIQ